MELIGPYLIGCVLLVVAGALKAIRPDDTARALVSVVAPRLRPVVRYRVLRFIVRLLSAVEAGLGAFALLVPRPLTAALVGASYVAFAVAVVYTRSRGGALASCGCFGTPDTPATYLHVGIDLLIGGAALAVAAEAPTTGWLAVVLSRQPLHGLPLVALAAVGAGTTYLALSGLARLQGVRMALITSKGTR
jgi:hypothetical protein